MNWINKTLITIERAAANARATIQEREEIEKKLAIAKAALLRIQSNIDVPGGYTNKDIATEALKEMEK
jgi:hypothetical protein